MTIRLLKGITKDGRPLDEMCLVVGMSPTEEERLVRGGDAQRVSDLDLPPSFAISASEADRLRLGASAKTAAAPLATDASGALIAGPSGRRVPLNSLARNGLRVAAATASIYFPLQDRQNSVQTDYSGTLQGNVKGGNSGRWSANPGMQFNGTNHRVECNTSLGNAPQYSSLVTPAIQGYTAAVRACANLASLVTDGDMILAWAVLSHGAGAYPADGMIAAFGMNADPTGKGGWGFGIKSGTAGKLQFWHRAVGSASMQATPLPMDGITGKNNNNTRTAIALQIYASPNAGLLQVDSYMLTLGTDGGVSQNPVGCITPALLGNGGTAACGADQKSPLTIGAMPDSIPYANLAPAGAISVGSNGHLTLTADYGAPGAQGSTLPFTQGIWMWFGNVATTPALTPKLYWVVFSTLRVGTIYSNGPGSAALNFTVGAAYGVPASNYVNFFTGAISRLGIQRRPRDYGLGMRVVRDLRADPVAFPACLGG